MYDIVFISYRELNAEENWFKVLDRFGERAKRLHGVKGIHAAHRAASQMVETDMFYVVDGDAIIMDDFNFDYSVADNQKHNVHVFRAKNPINDLIYGYGAVKLFPTVAVREINLAKIKPDMSSSLSNTGYKVVNTVSNITAFNTDPFNTWRSAFRECAKLASKVIDNQKDDETEQRLNTWCNVGIDKPNGIWSLKGAKAGRLFGKQYQSQPDKLLYINDMDWMKTKFNEARI